MMINIPLGLISQKGGIGGMSGMLKFSQVFPFMPLLLRFRIQRGQAWEVSPNF